MKLICIGLDGAAFKLIRRFTSKRLLPTFESLIQKGIYHPLPSTIPPHTAPGWTSSLTGVNPGKHGIYQFWDTQAPSYVGRYMGSIDCSVPPVWDILNQHGFTTGMMNIPMSHPPKPCNGYMITWPLSNTLRFCYPVNLSREITAHQGPYIPDLLTMYDGRTSDEEYLEKSIQAIRNRWAIAQYLIKNRPCDFFMAVFTEIDRISHFYWKYMDNTSSSLSHAVQTIYMEMDRVLGELIDSMDADTSLMVYSDHGFCRGDLDFYVHTFFENENLLQWKPAGNVSPVTGSWFTKKINGVPYIVDWKHTVAYMASPGSYGININLLGRQTEGIVPCDDFEAVCRQVIELLETIRHPVTLRPLFRSILRSDHIYHGTKSAGAPDIILVPENYGTMVHHMTDGDRLFSAEPEQNGMHDEDGVFLLYSPSGLLAGEHRRPENLQDIAPTMLSLFGVDIPAYMDGRSIFPTAYEKPSSSSVRCHVVSGEKAYLPEENEEIKKRLQSLGYL